MNEEGYEEYDIIEKILVDLDPKTISAIDDLVRDGQYQNVQEFLEKAVQNQILRHKHQIEENERKRSFNVGITRITRDKLEKAIQNGKQLDIFSVGSVSFDQDITPELVYKGIAKIRVAGALSADDTIQEAIRSKSYTMFGRKVHKSQEKSQKTLDEASD